MSYKSIAAMVKMNKGERDGAHGKLKIRNVFHGVGCGGGILHIEYVCNILK